MGAVRVEHTNGFLVKVQCCIDIFICKWRSSLRVKREVDPGKEINDALKSIWGGQCVADSDCVGFISYCDKDQGYTVLDGECRIVWWIWLILALVLLFILASCLSCICLPCCCLYNCCSGILDCLCNCLCCCFTKRRRGY